MNKIKYSKLWCHDLENSVIFKLLNNLSKKKFIKSNLENADVLFIGPYDNNSIKRRIIKGFIRRLKINEANFKNLDIYKMKRKINPLRIMGLLLMR